MRREQRGKSRQMEGLPGCPRHPKYVQECDACWDMYFQELKRFIREHPQEAVLLGFVEPGFVQPKDFQKEDAR